MHSPVHFAPTLLWAWELAYTQNRQSSPSAPIRNTHVSAIGESGIWIQQPTCWPKLEGERWSYSSPEAPLPSQVVFSSLTQQHQLWPPRDWVPGLQQCWPTHAHPSQTTHPSCNSIAFPLKHKNLNGLIFKNGVYLQAHGSNNITNNITLLSRICALDRWKLKMMSNRNGHKVDPAEWQARFNQKEIMHII